MKIGISLTALLLLSLFLPTPRVAGFSSSQLPAIRIGEKSSSNYGILTPSGGLAFDSSGNLWVADSGNRVLEFAPPFSDNVNASIVLGQRNFRMTGNGTAADRFHGVSYVTFDHEEDDLWVSDTWNNRLLEFQPPFFSGMDASVVIGQENFKASFYNVTRNGLFDPGQVAFDLSGNLWVADGGNSRILEFQPPFTTGMNASLVLGEPDFNHRYCQQGPFGVKTHCSNHSTLTYPSGVAFDQQGKLWVTETGPTFGIAVFKPPFTNGMQPSLVFGSVWAQNIAFDSSGNLWIACMECGHVAEFKPPFTEQNINWMAGAPTNAAVVLGGGVCCVAPDLMPNEISPAGLAFDSAGNMWVADFRDFWLMQNLIGRVVGYDAQVHPLDTHEGPVYFENRAGLLAPLTAIPLTEMNSINFPEGLFNFTIQGLQPGGSVELTIVFANPIAPSSEWLSKINGQWSVLPANRTSIQGNNLTLTLTTATQAGVISIFGGPAYPPPNLTSISETTSIIMTTPLSTQNQNPPTYIFGVIAVVVIVVAMLAIRKHGRKVRKEARTIA